MPSLCGCDIGSLSHQVASKCRLLWMLTWSVLSTESIKRRIQGTTERKAQTSLGLWNLEYESPSKSSAEEQELALKLLGKATCKSCWLEAAASEALCCCLNPFPDTDLFICCLLRALLSCLVERDTTLSYYIEYIMLLHTRYIVIK